jgi:Methyltransferase domain
MRLRIPPLLAPNAIRCTSAMLEPYVDEAIRHLCTTETRGSVLEVGCSGRGRLVDRTGFPGRVVGVDIRKSVQRAAKRVDPHLMLVVADIEHLPFRDSSFAGILSVSVLQYTERVAAIAELSRVCVSTAPVSLVENLEGSPFARSFRLLHRALGRKYPRHLEPKGHLRWAECEPIFRRDFEIIRLYPHNLTTPVLFLRFVLRRRSKSVNGAVTVPGLLLDIDRWLLRRLPFLDRFCWTVSLLGRRRSSAQERDR